MFSILTGSIIISLLHAVIPNHWLPVIAVGRRERWTLKEVTTVTLVAALAHALSTIALGVALSVLGKSLSGSIHQFTHIIAPVILIIMGLIFSYRHHKHKHFHITDEVKRKHTKKRIVTALAVAMFFSPCMEIEAYFLLAGTQPVWVTWCMSLIYLTITTSGMILLVGFAYKGLLKLNWHTLEHNAGMITGVTLIITGILSFFIH
ncbi:hypothetical protein SAMN05421788_107153 [Filimonas lacunae]|uniref:Urease accessory protein UreH-like transmembrane domain-containing protein n=1 Tax=Filimonas lacunae TaxID=477680 RepID=A0A173MGD4_9BACT|nr:hypothetical protein [Filimonas lacunae]BAV06491.1 hypothetical protein FLA_2510 [Filimonas lacunae]SIT27146.1 hypothetical protein SAMN05421788_107153 [Filimonas lacunae]